MRVIRENIYDMIDTLDILYQTNLLNSNIKELKPNKKFNQQCFYLVEDYLNDYNNHLKDVERVYKNRKNIKCIQLEVAIRFTKSKSFMKSITNKVIEYFTTSSYYLPYISFTNDNQSKIIIILFDRYFYPKGKKINVIAKSDYKNGKYKQGDIVRTETLYMSHKIRIFNFATKEQLKKYFEVLRLYLITSLDDIDEETLSDKQYVKKDGKHFKRKRQMDKDEERREQKISGLISDLAHELAIGSITKKEFDSKYKTILKNDSRTKWNEKKIYVKAYIENKKKCIEYTIE